MGTLKRGMDRRMFLQQGMVAGLAVGAPPVLAGDEKAKADTIDTRKILNYQSDMGYRRLGNTDIILSVISMGGLVSEPGVHAYAIDQGVNLVHISDTYLRGRSIRELGEVMKTRREKVYIALKDNFFTDEDYRKADFSKIDQQLKILNTDYVDFFMFNRHAAAAAKDALIGESFEKLKAMGKVRYAGLTSHDDVKGSMAAGIESGMYQLLHPAMNQSGFELLNEELKAAHAKGIGVMAMKTMRGMDSLELQTAFVKKLLGHPGVTTILKGIGSFEMFDAYKKAGHEVLTSMEDRKLYRYAQANRANNCMMCSECKPGCPLGVEIATVLRCHDYYYGQLNDVDTARETYAALPVGQRGGEECRLCKKCEANCPNGIEIVERLVSAERLFA